MPLIWTQLPCFSSKNAFECNTFPQYCKNEGILKTGEKRGYLIISDGTMAACGAYWYCEYILPFNNTHVPVLMKSSHIDVSDCYISNIGHLTDRKNIKFSYPSIMEEKEWKIACANWFIYFMFFWIGTLFSNPL